MARADAAKRLLGARPAGVDAYRYYEELLAHGDAGKWSNEYSEFRTRMLAAGVSLQGRTLLDVSGEPGLFCADARRDGAATATVTAFADNVASAITRYLKLNAVAYDFNSAKLREVVHGSFDFISCRYALGYCQDIVAFFAELRAVSAPGAYVYLSFSPPSLAVCSRWMFDDYTYLRQYTVERVLLAAAMSGFGCEREFDEGRYRFDHGLNQAQRLLTELYRRVLSRNLAVGSEYSTLFQHNVGLLLKLDAHARVDARRSG